MRKLGSFYSNKNTMPTLVSSSISSTIKIIKTALMLKEDYLRTTKNTAITFNRLKINNLARSTCMRNSHLQ